MSLPKETLNEIKRNIDDAEERIKSIEDVVTDLRKASIDASKEEEHLTEAKESVRKLRIFFEAQSKRTA